jgi:hypothetical protein
VKKSAGPHPESKKTEAASVADRLPPLALRARCAAFRENRRGWYHFKDTVPNERTAWAALPLRGIIFLILDHQVSVEKD